MLISYKLSSSGSWIRRHVNDHFVQLAKKDNYRSRAAYKLIELDDKFKLLKNCSHIVELGAAPGSWTEITLKRMKRPGKIVTIDLLEMEPVAPPPGIQCNMLVGDFLEQTSVDKVMESLRDENGELCFVDLVMSDMAPNTSGVQSLDHGRSMILSEQAYEFSKKVLKKGGHLILKIFQGAEGRVVLGGIKKDAKKEFQDSSNIQTRSIKE
ncbi:ribosomal RNA large subunit methyltransferase E [Acrasis kona]|uniref:rRNA methyltransferase 2, mitochondrial n=1 Tax=Acrasis kona TaxID=1008807 RepID=A0AAW2ZFK3_9EUKA